jgi:succinyl-CoA synthetase alpha subunit
VISGGEDTAESKILAMREAGITVVEGPHLLGRAMKDALGKVPRPKSQAAAPAKRPAATPPPARKASASAANAARGARAAKKAAKR